jgi:hypothetical protein
LAERRLTSKSGKSLELSRASEALGGRKALICSCGQLGVDDTKVMARSCRQLLPGIELSKVVFGRDRRYAGLRGGHDPSASQGGEVPDTSYVRARRSRGRTGGGGDSVPERRFSRPADEDLCGGMGVPSQRLLVGGSRPTGVGLPTRLLRPKSGSSQHSGVGPAVPRRMQAFRPRVKPCRSRAAVSPGDPRGHAPRLGIRAAERRMRSSLSCRSTPPWP